jgi:hypothetical protein
VVQRLDLSLNPDFRGLPACRPTRAAAWLMRVLSGYVERTRDDATYLKVISVTPWTVDAFSYVYISE